MNEQQKTAKDSAMVMLAFAEGRVIEFRYRFSSGWRETGDPSWDWDSIDYRIKPKPREWWVNEYSEGSFGGLCAKEEAAKVARFGVPFSKVIKVREVLE